MYYFRAALKRLAFNSSITMCYIMKTKNIKLYKYSTLLPNSKLFYYIMQSVLLVLLQGYFKKAGIQFKHNCYVMKTKNIKL